MFKARQPTFLRPETQAWLMVFLDKQIVSVLGNLGSRCGAQSLGAEVRRMWLRLGDGLEIIWKFVRWSFVGIWPRDDRDVMCSIPGPGSSSSYFAPALLAEVK
jgi:hypothetical protein